MQTNPLSEIITDEQYEQLMKDGLLNPLRVRDVIIKKRYEELKNGTEKMSSSERIDKIQREEYKYLTFETIRKIVMNKWEKRN